MSNELTNTGHVSALGLRLGPQGLFWGLAAPIIFAGVFVIMAAIFAPASIRPIMAASAAPVARLAFLAAPLWYLRGWARWAMFGLMVGVLSLGLLMHGGMLWLASQLA